MTLEYTATDDTGTTDSFFGESKRGDDATDEQRLYGDPCHESGSGFDEKTMYGEPQHDSGDASEVRDIELLFVQMQASTGASTDR